MEESHKKLLIECLIALLIGLIAAGALAHLGPTTLSEDTYAQALRLMHGTPQGMSEIAARALFAALSPFMGWKMDGMGLVSFYLAAPVFLLVASSILAYAALRLWKFGRVEAAGATLLLMLASPVAFAFYPGLWMSETVAIPLALLGLAGLAEAAREKDSSAPVALLVFLIGTCAAVAVMPAMAALPLSIFIGEVVLGHRDVGALWRVRWKAIRLVCLLAPIGVAIAMHPPVFTLSLAGTMAFVYESRFAIGLALVALPALLMLDKHPLAPMMAGASAVAIVFGTLSPAAAMLALLLPAAYGIRTLGMLGEQSMLDKGMLLGAGLGFTAIGLFAHSGDSVALLGLAVMTAGAGITIALVYGWPSGLVRVGLLSFLLCSALLVASQDRPRLNPDAPGPYAYTALSPGVQDALHWLGQNHESGKTPRVAVLAPEAAIELLTGGAQAVDNDSWVRYLASSNQTSPLKRGDYVVAYPELLSQIKSDDLALSKPWTMVVFDFAGTGTQQGQQVAVFYSAEAGMLLQQPMLDNDTLTSGKPQLFNGLTGQPLGALYAGDTGLLLPRISFRSPANRLLWYKEEYTANVLKLFRDNGSIYSPVYANGTMVTEQVIG